MRQKVQQIKGRSKLEKYNWHNTNDKDFEIIELLTKLAEWVWRS